MSRLKCSLVVILLGLCSNLALWADSNKLPTGSIWNKSWSVGEDAQHSTFYFVKLEAGQVSRVRIMSNGGSTRKPIVKDYFIESRSVRVVTKTADRKHLPELIGGKDSGLEQTSDFYLKRWLSEEAEATAKPLTKEQRNDLLELTIFLADWIEHQIRFPEAERAGK